MVGIDPPKEKKVILNRNQKRFKDRIEKEAETFYLNLVIKFTEFIISCDGEEEVKDERRRLIAQWTLYCKTKGLTKAAEKMLEQSLDKVIAKYNQQGGKVRINSKWSMFKSWLKNLFR